jgi:hypothetical protein
MTLRRLALATVLGGTAALGCGCGNTAEPTDEEPAQYISVRRAWRPGERDSVAGYVVRTGAWGQYSELAATAVWAWDSTTDVILNPEWQPTAAPVPGLRLAARFAAGWGSAGIDVRIVFDSQPDVAGIQKDSLDWVITLWWNPADSTWKGYLLDATTDSTFVERNVDTALLDASSGKDGAGGGESRAASGTYWEADDGTYRINENGNYGGLSTITSGPFLGGNIQYGLMGGRLRRVRMPRISGTDAPTSQTVDYDFRSARIGSQRMFCYFAPVIPPPGYTQCTGQAFASIIAAARAGRTIATLSGPP